jgi:hypothetical protein
LFGFAGFTSTRLKVWLFLATWMVSAHPKLVPQEKDAVPLPLASNDVMSKARWSYDAILSLSSTGLHLLHQEPAKFVKGAASSGLKVLQ